MLQLVGYPYQVPPVGSRHKSSSAVSPTAKRHKGGRAPTSAIKKEKSKQKEVDMQVEKTDDVGSDISEEGENDSGVKGEPELSQLPLERKAVFTA